MRSALGKPYRFIFQPDFQSDCFIGLSKVCTFGIWDNFISKELSSVGWTMLFNREGYDSFGAKCHHKL
ncbi:MAG: hypothetical protein U2P89_05060 [Proteiniphilum sp.]|uniref:hypothetical protein n=1 Tax=Proteiniphilum sp. TaxID=1926877 RepID=UPI002AB96508|nr:hypothetical protein [Proteiniphilum sp.]MDY9918227.1 hypothetical protein [Proteiniphilum sp.]